MTTRTIGVNLGVALGGRRWLWLVGGLAGLWLFARHLTNPWDIVMSATQQNPVTFVVIPLYLFLQPADLLNPWQSLTALRLGSTRVWWWTHVAAAGLLAGLLAGGLAAAAGIVALASGRWSWRWGRFGHLSEYPAVLAREPWSVPWHYGLIALGFLFGGLWAVGVLRLALTLWWQGPWMAWLAVVTLGLLTVALSNTVLQGVVWWLPGAQFSFYYHWTPVGSRTVSWTLGYTPLLATVAAAAGLWMADQPPWHAPQGEAP